MTPEQVQEGLLSCLSPIVTEKTWMLKNGRRPAVLTFQVPGTLDARKAIYYYRDLMKLAGFEATVRHWVFSQVTGKIDNEYPIFIVDEVGYKLSKRKERLRPNQLMRFLGSASETEKPNLHLADEEVKVVVDADSPQRVLDYIRKQVTWR